MLENINRAAIEPALALLPARMKSKEALVMLYAIGLQESQFKYRRQMGSGPAQGFWQFEKMGGVDGVLQHRTTAAQAVEICRARGVAAVAVDVHAALEHDDVLAAAFARLLLWTDAKSLPALGDVDGAFSLYIRTWRPGAYSRGNEQQRADIRVKFSRYYAQALLEVGTCSA